MLRWFLSLHSPKHAYSISPKKLPKAPDDEDDAEDKENVNSNSQVDTNTEVAKAEDDPKAGASSILPSSASVFPVPRTPRKKGSQDDEDDESDGLPSLPAPPTPFTPSIHTALNRAPAAEKSIHPLPEGLTVDILKARLDGKKKVK